MLRGSGRPRSAGTSPRPRPKLSLELRGRTGDACHGSQFVLGRPQARTDGSVRTQVAGMLMRGHVRLQAEYEGVTLGRQPGL
jgi:hypothetical protein